MSEFKNVTIIKKAAVYFDGHVTSRLVRFDDGSEKTLGFMMPGEYTFSTSAGEIMEIMEGECDVLLPGTDVWKRIKGGQSFNIPASSEFMIKVMDPVDYCCSYLK